jgi:hypothetical protein
MVEQQGVKASRFRQRQTAGSNFLGKIFVERLRFIYFLKQQVNLLVIA